MVWEIVKSTCIHGDGLLAAIATLYCSPKPCCDGRYTPSTALAAAWLPEWWELDSWAGLSKKQLLILSRVITFILFLF